MPTHLPILYVGDRSSPEFSPIADWLALRGSLFESSVPAALTRIEAGFSPAIIVVAQPWPGHISSEQIALLRSAVPLARIVSLLGTWLEGEARTGKPWPGVWRTYWHQWLPRFADQLDRLATGETTIWSLPVTAGDDERLLAANNLAPQSAMPLALSPKKIAIIASSRETAETLADACHGQKWETAWLATASDAIPKNISLILFDSRNLNAAEIAQISQLQASSVPVVVLAGFPRVHEVEQLHAGGTTAVISKPFTLDDLLRKIRQLLANRSNRNG